MAKMIPNFIHPDCKSNAEKLIFQKFSAELSDNYSVLHSLGIAKHGGKLRGEIDFVVVCPKGILCIEVKGGRIKQENGIWYFTNKFGESFAKKESPFEQASSGMYALRKGLEKKFGWNSPQCQSILGYCVFFPDQKFSLESPEWDLNRLIDEKKLTESISTLIEMQYNYSMEEIARITGKKNFPFMSQSEVSLLLRYLRPNFEKIPSLSSIIQENHRHLLKMTEEQFDILDQLAANDRILIQGGAGTGKTVLAAEKARREIQKGKRVLYLCYNKLLATHIQASFQDEIKHGLIEINTLHSYAKKIIKNAGLALRLNENTDEDLFREKYPDVFEQAVVELFEAPPFDICIVDEGQDLRFEAYIKMIDWLIEGGIQNGRWVWFEDSQQNIFNVGVIDGISIVEESRPVVCQLTRNCRNTKPISIFNSLTTGVPKQKCLVNKGLKVDSTFFRSKKHQQKLLENLLQKLLGGGIVAEDIVLLSPFTKQKSVLDNLDSIAGMTLKEYPAQKSNHSKILQYTTVQKFKGLESKVVIVTDILKLKESVAKSINYVAFSRATSYLQVLMHESTEKDYGDLAFEFALRD